MARPVSLIHHARFFLGRKPRLSSHVVPNYRLGLLWMTVLMFLVSGCTLFPPGVNVAVKGGNDNVDPPSGIRLSLTGLGTHLESLRAMKNGRAARASLNEDGYLTINSSREIKTDEVYEVALSAIDIRDKRAVRNYVFKTAQTPRPYFRPGGVVATIEDGAEISWNIPLKTFSYTITPEVATTSHIDNTRCVTVIEIPDYKQGQRYKINITEALGLNGYRLKKNKDGYVAPFITTVPLTVTVEPGNGAEEVSRSTGVVFTFNDEVINQENVTGLFAAEPFVPGTLSWPALNKIVFTPSAPWDFETLVTVRLLSGTNGLRGKSGSFIEGDVASSFTTGVYKRIDVNLSEQRLTCLEGGTPIFTCLVSSGKSGYSTPTGNYRIYSKNWVAPMGSAESAAEPYYISDVPFVMWFNGSYSIHGAYWHNEFGNVRSHGCVNIPVDAAEQVFGWASVGTPVTVHY